LRLNQVMTKNTMKNLFFKANHMQLRQRSKSQFHLFQQAKSKATNPFLIGLNQTNSLWLQ